MQLPRPSGLITLLTDFGARDPYVGIMKGIIKRHHARADVVDLCHEVPPQALRVGALFLGAAVGRFPTGTIHVAVVDPGVGTARRFLCAYRHECFWVGPDNGLLEPALPAGEAGELRAVDAKALQLEPQSATFHGRDVFAPLAGLLASQRLGFRAVGPRIDDPVRLPASTRAEVVCVDRFGNLITNVAASRVAPGITVGIAGRKIPLRATYADGRPGEIIALVNSFDLLEIAQCQGDASQALGAGAGAAVELE
jgi:S-adenosylmethionine hydrolase